MKGKGKQTYFAEWQTRCEKHSGWPVVVSHAVLNHGVRELKSRLEWEMKTISVDINSDWSIQVLEINISSYMPPFDVLVVKDTIYGFVGSRQISALADLEIGESACREWATRVVVDMLRNTWKDRFPPAAILTMQTSVSD